MEDIYVYNNEGNLCKLCVDNNKNSVINTWKDIPVKNEDYM